MRSTALCRLAALTGSTALRRLAALTGSTALRRLAALTGSTALRRLAALTGVAALAGCGMPMQNIDAENRAFAWSGHIAACADAGVLASITTRFAQAQAGLAGQGRQIEQIESIRQTGLRRNGRSYIPRRDCQALARLDDASLQPVYYTIVAGIDAYGLADRVEFCVAAHDPYHLGPSACTRMSR